MTSATSSAYIEAKFNTFKDLWRLLRLISFNRKESQYMSWEMNDACSLCEEAPRPVSGGDKKMLIVERESEEVLRVQTMQALE